MDLTVDHATAFVRKRKNQLSSDTIPVISSLIRSYVILYRLRVTDHVFHGLMLPNCEMVLKILTHDRMSRAYYFHTRFKIFLVWSCMVLFGGV